MSKGNRGDHKSLDAALVAWGEDMPAWVRRLAEECDKASQNQVAKKVGYSASALSSVINNRYGGANRGGDLAAIEKAVSGVFDAVVVDCPVLGKLPAQTCLLHQRQPISTANPQAVRLYRACRDGCPHSRLGGS